MHKVHKQTRDHNLIDLNLSLVPKEMCEPCKYENKERAATYICKECEEYFCDSCIKYHRAQKQNRSHQINSISEKLLCESCQAIGEINSATSCCLDCEEPELFCQSCAKRHLSVKNTKHHHISDNLHEFAFM